VTDVRTNHYGSNGSNGSNGTVSQTTGGNGGPGYTVTNGTVNNYANITGGTGGKGAEGFSYYYFNTYTGGDYLEGVGQYGGMGGMGGTGVNLRGGLLFNETGASIKGGNGGDGNFTAGPGYRGGYGGAGGAGVNVSAGALYNETGASIKGGNGGNATSGDNSYANGGVGGTGVTLSADTTLTNSNGATITGGQGGNGTPGAYSGAGGIGVSVNNGTVANMGAIAGGSGGAEYGNGGVGVSLDGGTLVNTGTITGGAASPGRLGYGGAGVYLNGGRVETSGTITAGGGNPGYAGDAVRFGSAAGTLIVDPGAVFNGQVAANASVNDTLQLTGTQLGGTGITLGTQFTNFETLDFAPGALWTVDLGAGAATSTALTIKGFTSGDTVDIINQSPGKVAGDFGATATSYGGGKEVFKGSDDPQFSYAADGTATFSTDFSGEYFILTPDGQGGTDVTVSDTPCFRRGTRILGEHGEVAVEALKIGDRIVTTADILQPIRWIGRRSYTGTAATGNPHLLPVRIRGGALGANLPKRDLWVSPEHAMYVDGLLIPAVALLNGASIVQENVVEELSYFHLEFESHCIVFAEGAPSESFVDDDSREMFDNAWEFRQLYPHKWREPARFCAPRVSDGWELEAVRQRLAARLAGIEAEGVFVPHALQAVQPAYIRSV